MPHDSNNPPPPSPGRAPRRISRAASSRLGEGRGEGRTSIGARHLIFFLCLLPSSFCPPSATRANEPQFTPVLTARTWSFPRDHGRHDGFKTEWWYFTGNLREKSTGRRFGYQLTFFRSAFVPHATTRPSPWAMSDLYFAHAAISDIDAQIASQDGLEVFRRAIRSRQNQYRVSFRIVQGRLDHGAAALGPH